MNYHKGASLNDNNNDYLGHTENHSKCLPCLSHSIFTASHGFLRYEVLYHRLNFITWCNWSSERLHKLPEDTQLVNGRDRSRTWNLCLLIIPHIVLSFGVVTTMETLYGMWNVVLYLLSAREHMHKSKFKEMNSLGGGFRKGDVSFCLNVSQFLHL